MCIMRVGVQGGAWGAVDDLSVPGSFINKLFQSKENKEILCLRMVIFEAPNFCNAHPLVPEFSVGIPEDKIR